MGCRVRTVCGRSKFHLGNTPPRCRQQPANNVARPAPDPAPFARPWASLANRLAGVATLLASDVKPLAKGAKSLETPDFQGFLRPPKKT